jgi:hypothetical protein
MAVRSRAPQDTTSEAAEKRTLLHQRFQSAGQPGRAPTPVSARGPLPTFISIGREFDHLHADV